MYNDGLHCRTVFSLFFVELRWSLFYELDFSFSSVGEYIVCCSCLDFVFCRLLLNHAACIYLPRYEN